MRLVASCGNANVDIFVVVDEFPRADQEVIAFDAYVMAGGSAANFSVAVHRLGRESCFVGCVGDDELGREFVEDLRRSGVCTRYVVTVPGAKTGRVVVMIKSSTGERAMVAFRGANERLSADLFPRSLFNECKHFHVSSVPPRRAEAFLRLARAAGATTSYDPGGYASEGIASFEAALRHTDVLFVNRVEARLMTGLDLERAVRSLADSGPRVVVVKLGPEGSLAVSGGAVERAPAFRVSVVDTTGAGDAFNAGFIHAFLGGLSLSDSLTLGNAVAAIKIGRRGARSSPALNEVVDFLAKRGYPELAEKLLNQ